MDALTLTVTMTVNVTFDCDGNIHFSIICDCVFFYFHSDTNKNNKKTQIAGSVEQGIRMSVRACACVFYVTSEAQ